MIFGAVVISTLVQTASMASLACPNPNVRNTTTKSGSVVSTAVSYLHHDQLGSVRLVSDSSGQSIEADTYRPFGEQQKSPTGTPPESKGFIGERFDADADAGLQYLNARYYDPKLGMFLQPDWFEVTDPGVGTNR